jgi:arabinofuranosyltransferase
MLLFMLAALASLNRIDTPLYYALPLGYAALTSTLPYREKMLGFILWLTPIAIWHFFTLFYFGFPLQNAAYAKRFNNLPLSEYLSAGVDYYLNSINRDPVTLTIITTALALALISGNRKLQIFATGIGAYLIYVLFIGGDIMSGRFFSLAFLASIIVILHSGAIRDTISAVIAIGLVILVGALSPHSPFLNDRNFGQLRENSPTSEWKQRGITDERSSWYQHSGLLLSSRFADMPISLPAWEFRQHAVNFVNQHVTNKTPCVGMVMPTGYFGFAISRECHIYDSNGQVDPLMARIPFSLRREWRQGHLMKPIPEGYQKTLETGKNHIADPNIAAFYDHLSLITRGELWSWNRAKTIVKMNLGHYDHLLNANPP